MHRTTTSLLSLLPLVTAHGYIDTLTISSTTYPGYNPTIAPWVPDQSTITWPAWNTNNGPVYSSSVSHPDIICSINSTNPHKTASPIAAGTNLTLHWTTWPDSHHGPIISYLAACNGPCETVDKTALRFFKIAEMGQLSLGVGGGKPGRWADDVLKEQNGTWEVEIPAEIAPGKYVLRHEILALHSAYDAGAAQFYPQCVSIEVSGEGTATPEGVAGTELYSEEDPGVHYNIYNDESKPVYQIPGPKLCKFLLCFWRKSLANVEAVTG